MSKKIKYITNIKFYDINDKFDEQNLMHLSIDELDYLEKVLSFTLNGGIESILKHEDDIKSVEKYIEENL